MMWVAESSSYEFRITEAGGQFDLDIDYLGRSSDRLWFKV